jgi:hypothetical protein
VLVQCPAWPKCTVKDGETDGFFLLFVPEHVSKHYAIQLDSRHISLERFLHVAELEIGVGVEDLVAGHALSDHSDDRRDRDPQAADARDAVHLVRANGDAREGHEQRVPRPAHRSTDGDNFGVRVAVSADSGTVLVNSGPGGGSNGLGVEWVFTGSLAGSGGTGGTGGPAAPGAPGTRAGRAEQAGPGP